MLDNSEEVVKIEYKGLEKAKKFRYTLTNKT